MQEILKIPEKSSSLFYTESTKNSKTQKVRKIVANLLLKKIQGKKKFEIFDIKFVER